VVRRRKRNFALARLVVSVVVGMNIVLIGMRVGVSAKMKKKKKLDLREGLSRSKNLHWGDWWWDYKDRECSLHAALKCPTCRRVYDYRMHGWSPINRQDIADTPCNKCLVKQKKENK
jgi:hypothetical protein